MATRSKSKKPAGLPQRHFVSLAETLTWMAFGRALRLDKLNVEAEKQEGEYGSQQDFFEKLAKAVELLCDAAMGNAVRLQGRFGHTETGAGKNSMAAVPGDRLAEYSLFYIATGALFQRAVNEPFVVWKHDEAAYARFFDLNRYHCFVDVAANREDLILEFGPKGAVAKLGGPKFTEKERKAWILVQEQMSADNGFRRFRQHPRYDGTKQKAFREIWKMVRQTKPGRPRID